MTWITLKSKGKLKNKSAKLQNSIIRNIMYNFKAALPQAYAAFYYKVNMRVLVQRVAEASVTIENKIKSQIGKGLLILLGIENSDNQEDIEWICNKIINLRIFDDSDGVMNLSSTDINAEMLIVSQFTLHASTKKGNRPSYIRASKPDIAIPLYEEFCKTFENKLGKTIQTGEFGANMQVKLINDGPVTIWIDSKNKE